MSTRTDPMEESSARQKELAALSAAIERLAGDLTLAEEPSRFVAALEAGRAADGEGAPR